MRSSSLGSQGPEISTLGLGTWPFSGPYDFGWGPQDDNDSIAAIRFAIEAGVTWLDTAPIYGYGHAEEVVGKAVEPYRADVMVFTKCGLRWNDPVAEEVRKDLRPASIRTECEDSLRRLALDHIDLYQIHWPEEETGTPLEESWATMVDLVQEGKVRWIGVSNFTTELLERCTAIRHVDSLQPPLSLLNDDARSAVIPWCPRHGTGVISYSTLASGLLTGTFAAASLAPDDWRRRAPEFQEPELSKRLAAVDRLRPIAEELGVGLPALAAAWVLHVPGVSGAIVGARRPDQVASWLQASSLSLSASELDEIERAINPAR